MVEDVSRLPFSNGRDLEWSEDEYGEGLLWSVQRAHVFLSLDRGSCRFPAENVLVMLPYLYGNLHAEQ